MSVVPCSPPRLRARAGRLWRSLFWQALSVWPWHASPKMPPSAPPTIPPFPHPRQRRQPDAPKAPIDPRVTPLPPPLVPHTPPSLRMAGH